MRNVYMDSNATTRIDPRVVEAMSPFLSDLWGNPSSMHAFGGQVKAAVDGARQQVAALVGASHPSEVVFTSCGTESDNAAIHSALQAFPQKRHIVTSRVEHPAVRSVCHHLRRRGYRITELPVDGDGQLDLMEYEESLTGETALVSVMWANNETGVTFPVERMAAIAQKHGVLFHTDAVQAVGKIPMDLSQSAINMLSLSGHKLHAPKGVGALYIKKGTPFRPFIRGGHQENGRRAGTEPVHQLAALGEAAAVSKEHLDDEQTRVRALRNRLENGLLKTIPDSRVNGDRENRLPNTTNISFESVEGEGILLLLSDAGVAASSGSACTSGTLEPSHVLRAMGVPFNYAHGSLRLSLSRFNDEADVDYVLEVLPPIISKLREISPFYKPSSS